jgi:Xaa-Pro aminopeptidase
MKKRLDNLVKLIKKKKLDGFLTKNQANIRYLTGIIQPEGWLLCSRSQELIFFTNPISPKPSKDKSYLKTVIVKSNFIKQISLSAKKIKLKKIGFSDNDLSLNCYQRLKENLIIKKIDLVPSGSLIKKLRICKDKKEIKLIKKAASFSLEAFAYAKEIFNQTMTEKDLSIEIERFLKIKADNQTAFPTIVASGKNSIFAHHNPKEVLINNYFLIDLGAMHYGYCADLTRVFFWGKMPFLFQKVYNTIKKAQETAINQVKEGKKASDIDKAARDVISKNGFGKYFTHGLGHGVGLEVHEPPYLKPGRDETLKEGMVITIEPGIYYKNQFGIRLETMVIVKTKNAEVIA